jgi:alkylation response protein AidB-like acyl-CoA dehydrogenase
VRPALGAQRSCWPVLNLLPKPANFIQCFAALRDAAMTGMAKLLGARVAWASADNALQIHGGNGFALEYQISRILCDARILNIFEGAAEIQAQVIARRLLG